MKRTKKGFTLIELLIVIAIIAILIAIAVPTFAAQLTKAKTATDDANLRAATSLAVADYMLADSPPATQLYSAVKSGESMEVVTVAAFTAAPTGAYPRSNGTGYIKITIVDGAVTGAGW